MIDDIPPWLHINRWQQTAHHTDDVPDWTSAMDYEVRRYMDGKIVAQTAALLAGSTIKRVEGRARVLMMMARGRCGLAP